MLDYKTEFYYQSPYITAPIKILCEQLNNDPFIDKPTDLDDYVRLMEINVSEIKNNNESFLLDSVLNYLKKINQLIFPETIHYNQSQIIIDILENSGFLQWILSMLVVNTDNLYESETETLISLINEEQMELLSYLCSTSEFYTEFLYEKGFFNIVCQFHSYYSTATNMFVYNTMNSIIIDSPPEALATILETDIVHIALYELEIQISKRNESNQIPPSTLLSTIYQQYFRFHQPQVLNSMIEEYLPNISKAQIRAKIPMMNLMVFLFDSGQIPESAIIHWPSYYDLLVTVKDSTIQIDDEICSIATNLLRFIFRSKSFSNEHKKRLALLLPWGCFLPRLSKNQQMVLEYLSLFIDIIQLDFEQNEENEYQAFWRIFFNSNILQELCALIPNMPYQARQLSICFVLKIIQIKDTRLINYVKSSDVLSTIILVLSDSESPSVIDQICNALNEFIYSIQSAESSFIFEIEEQYGLTAILEELAHYSCCATTLYDNIFKLKQ